MNPDEMTLFMDNVGARATRWISDLSDSDKERLRFAQECILLWVKNPDVASHPNVVRLGHDHALVAFGTRIGAGMALLLEEK